MSRIIARKRLGNSTEDIATITSGPLSQNIAIVDGYDVLIVPLSAKATGSRKLFDIFRLGIKTAPRGMAYLPSEDLLILNDITQPTKLFLTDFSGQPRGIRTVEYLNNFVPDQLEGIATLPVIGQPEQLIMSAVTFAPELQSRLVVLTLIKSNLYRVTREIFPPDPVGTDFISGIGPTISTLPRQPAQFLVAVGNFIQAIAGDGSLLGDPVELSEAISVEGLDLAGTTYFAADVFAGKLFAFDQRLSRSKPDRDYKIGVGLSSGFGLAWDAGAGQHLVLSFTSVLPQNMQISRVPRSLDSATRLVDLPANNFRRGRRMTYVDSEGLIAVAHQTTPKAILLFDKTGALAETIDVSAIGSPVAIAYIPTTNEFALRVNEAGKATTLFIVNRTGQLVRTLNLAGTGIRSIVALTFFNPGDPSGGQFFIVDGPLSGDPIIDLAFVTDFTGKPLTKVNYRDELGVLTPIDVATITTGPDAGALAILDRSSNELVVFSLD